MKLSFLPLAFLATMFCCTPLLAGDPPSSCKPVKQYGVSGCELLPDRTCSPGYHKQVVDPPNPLMKAPSRLMCVPDKPSSDKPASDKPAPEKPPAKDPPKPESKTNS